MTIKEKLDLLWKYLLLLVLVYGFTMMGRTHSMRFMDKGRMGSPHHDMMWFSDGDHDLDMDGIKNVEVFIKKLDDGDSTMVITVNGETIDVKDFDLTGMDKEDGPIIIKKWKLGDKHEKKTAKIIRKKVKIKDD